MKKTGKDVKAHIRYKNKAGKSIPGVTTVLNVLAKPALIHWAWKLGTQGIDYRAFRDDAADIGKLTHSMILADLKGEEYDTSEYTSKQINLAENSFLKYLDWKKAHAVSALLVEHPLVSEEYQYGGTLDFFGTTDEFFTLIDFKTGDRMYLEYIYQLAAYNHLLEENRYKPPQKYFLIGIPKTENMNFHVIKISSLSKAFRTFLACRKVYELQKLTKKEYKF